MHGLDVAVLVDEVPDAGVDLGLLEVAECVLLLVERLVLLLIVLVVVLVLAIEMVVTLVVFEIVHGVERVIVPDVVLLLRTVFDDAHLLDYLDLPLQLLELQRALFDLVVAEPQGLAVHLGEHGLSELILQDGVIDIAILLLFLLIISIFCFEVLFVRVAVGHDHDQGGLEILLGVEL